MLAYTFISGRNQEENESKVKSLGCIFRNIKGGGLHSCGGC